MVTLIAKKDQPGIAQKGELYQVDEATARNHVRKGRGGYYRPPAPGPSHRVVEPGPEVILEIKRPIQPESPDNTVVYKAEPEKVMSFEEFMELPAEPEPETLKELQAWLREHGVPFNKSDRKPRLLKRYQEARDA